jgi:hypothetical protein
MSSQPGKPNPAIESAVERIRELNDRIVRAAKQGGEESLKTYERMLENLADAQEAAGDRGAEWIREFARAQASFTRQLADAFPALLQRLGARGKDLGARAAGQPRRVPGVSGAEDAASGATATASGATATASGAAAGEEDLPIPGYDSLTVQVINQRLRGLSPEDLSKIDAYEARTKNRKTVRDRISALRRAQPPRP